MHKVSLKLWQVILGLILAMIVGFLPIMLIFRSSLCVRKQEKPDLDQEHTSADTAVFSDAAHPTPTAPKEVEIVFAEQIDG